MRTLALLCGLSVIAVVGILSNVATGRATAYAPVWRALAPADSDSTDVGGLRDLAAEDSLRPDSLVSDSLLADSTATGPDSSRAAFYLPSRQDQWMASRFQRGIRPLSIGLGNYWKHEVYVDSLDGSFVAREYVGDDDVRYPLRMDFDTYRRYRLEQDLADGWRDAAELRARQQNQRRGGGFGFNIVVPGGQQSAFTTIFGKPQVDLRVSGQADIRAGFNYRKSDQQVAFTGRATQIDPDFKQDLRLGITGTIGDKLEVGVNWDTNNQFDYQNQLKLHYKGYEDEIIQNIEAGNVLLSTPSRLIRGGQSLFGIKSEFQLGALNVTTVASQQEGQANELAIEGGSETTEFDLKPTDYDGGRHFFVSYYFRNRWEDALSQPPNILLADGFERITEIEVWRLDTRSGPEQDNVRQVVAMVDLAEPRELLELADAYTQTVLPSPAVDQYTDTDVADHLRPGSVTPNDFLRAKGLKSYDFQVGQFVRLERGVDYQFDDVLGYVSLSTSVPETEALAVAYRYVANGQSRQVGEFLTEAGGSVGGQTSDRLVLKLLRPSMLTQPAPEQNSNPAAWYLELRNIYNLRASGINPSDFELQIFYEPPGKSPSKNIPEVTGQEYLLRALGLDRLNQDGGPQPDDLFDYLQNFTINPSTGQLIFPYLEPFGERIDDLIEQRGGSAEEQQAKRNLYVYESLYQQKKENARRNSQFDVYRIRGSFRGSVQSHYDLRAFSGLIPGSVVVTSGGSRLAEGADFIVDYAAGTVQIVNPAYLTSGRDIKIAYEQNSFFNLQKKTMLGAVAEYQPDDRMNVYATLMRLNQKSPIDKFRIGEEPISNLMWGAGGTLDLEPRWLTHFVDLLPFIQTKAPSSIRLSGEFAQLRPGASETIAFERTRRSLRDQGLDFKTDELEGISYIDDFEGFENTFSLKQAGAWRLSSPPDSIGAVDPLPGDPEAHFGAHYDSLRTNWRANFAWYTLNRNTLEDLTRSNVRWNEAYPHMAKAIDNVLIQEVYPNRDVSAEVDRTLQTLDVYFNPHQRGPYNYTRDLRGFLDQPQHTWGGMISRLPEGYTDFSLKNIEFIEFVFRPFVENGANDAGSEAKLYVDLGSISEDVLPDQKLNTEDGLSLTDASPSSIRPWGRLSQVSTDAKVDINDETRRTEDLGLDGLASYDLRYYDPLLQEQEHFRDFLESLDRNSTDPRYRAEVAKALADPSGDDYHNFNDEGYFRNPDFFPNGATLQEWLTRWFPGLELNSYEARNRLSPGDAPKQGNSRVPDSEDLNLNSTVDVRNNYFQYEVPLSLGKLDELADPSRVDDYVVTEITTNDGVGTGWYQVRIPVRDFTRRVGQIQDFSLIESIRFWTTGHQTPVTLRFASIELVGSQWQKAPVIASERELLTDSTVTGTRFSISSLNNEENPNTYRSPNGTIVSQMRLATGGTQFSREQAMVLDVENLMPGKQRAVSKTQTQPLDLLKYGHLRMFVHMHGQTADGQPIRSRDKVAFFLRLGANETNDYYEYEMPLSPSEPDPANLNPDALWQTNQMVNGQVRDLNSVHIILDALNQLKVARDNASFRPDSVYWSDADGVALNPAVEDFAPPGTRIGIKGTPSLGRINTIVLGVRNMADSTVAGMGMPNRVSEDILQYVSVWVNELRVSGYDETNGRAALANADVKLADLGTVRASFQWQEDGFGSLASTLAERDQNDILNWSVTTEVNLDKFIPERYGWGLPVNFQIQNNSTTPRFAPQRGDIRLESLLDQIRADPNLTEEERAFKLDSTFAASQVNMETRSITASVRKTNSDSRLLRYTLDGLSLNYSFSDNDGRSPTQQMNDAWRWTTTAGYRFNVRQPKTVRPFWFVDDLPVIGALGDLRFNYVPQSLTLNGSATRNFTQLQDRPLPRRQEAGDQLAFPDAVRYPLREQHSMAHRRSTGLQYNPFPFLNLTFDTNTNQSLNAIGVDTLFSVVVVDSLGTTSTLENLDLATALHQGLIDSSQLDVSAFELTRLRVQPTGRVVNRIFSDQYGDLLRTDRNDQRFTASFRPQLNQIKALNFLQVQDVVFSSNYSWQNGAVGRPTGATVGNQVELRGGFSLKAQELWRKFGFYRSLEDAQREADAEAQAERRQRDQEREARRREKEERREAERKHREQMQLLLAEGKEDEAAALDSTFKAGRIAAADAAREEAAQEEMQEEVQEDDGGFRLPLPNPVSLLRRTALALTGMRDLTVTYNGTRTSNSSNVGEPVLNGEGEVEDVDVAYSLLQAFRGNGPSAGYRFGFERTVPLYGSDGQLNRVIDPRFQVSDVYQNAHRLQARTMLNPSQSFQINVNWNLDWRENENLTFRPQGIDDLGRLIVDTTRTANGDNRSSIWAFGADFSDLFQSQLDEYLSDLANAPAGEVGTVIRDNDRDGRVVLTNKTVGADFRSAFVRGLGTIDRNALLPFPLPGWQMTYSGISRWPLIRRLVNSASLRHGYAADYSTNFTTNTAAVMGDSTGESRLANMRVIYTVPLTEIGSIRVNERYQPLIGVDLSWKGRLQTNLAYNKSNAYTLSAGMDVGESKTNEITFTGSFQRQGLSLPFFENLRLNNRVNLSVTVSYATIDDKRYITKGLLESYIANPDAFVLEDALTGDRVQINAASTRLRVSPQLAYQFSNRVSANFQLNYENFQSQDSRTPSATTINGGFNVRVSISNN